MDIVRTMNDSGLDSLKPNLHIQNISKTELCKE